MFIRKEKGKFSVIAMALLSMAFLMTGCGSGSGSGSGSSSGGGKNSDNIVLEKTPPGAVTNLLAKSAGANQINLDWRETVDDTSTSADIVYEICLALVAGDCDTFTVTATTAPGANTHSLTGLEFSTDYYYRVRAKDESGNTGTVSNEVLVTTDPEGTVNAPTFNPVANTYGSAQTVAINTATADATICYTADETTPACDAEASCTTGTPYTEAVSVDADQTLNALACLASDSDSIIASSAYTIDTAAPGVVTDLSASAAGESQISLNWTAVTDDISRSNNMVYEICQSKTTGDCGESFTASHTTASGASSFTVTGLSTLTDYYFQIRAKDEVGNISNASDEATASTDASGTVNAPDFNITPGIYESEQNIEISTSTSGATIYYTTSDHEPSASDTEYTEAIIVAGDGTSATIKAIAVKTDFTDSSVAAATYELHYPTELTISINNANTVTLTDFQVRVVLEDHIVFDDFSETGDEVRFYSGNKELSYYVESFDKEGQSAVYWVKVDSLPAETTTDITMSPFKAGLAAASDGNSTFVFFDDFERAALGGDWTTTPTEGTVGINNGMLEIHGVGDSFISTTSATLNDIPNMAPSDSFVAVAKMYRDYQVDMWWSLNGVSTAASDHPNNPGLWLRNTGGSYNSNKQSGIWKTYQITVDDANNIDFERGNSIDSLNELITGTRSTPGSSSMRFGYSWANNKYVRVDWVFIRKFAAVDPTISY